MHDEIQLYRWVNGQAVLHPVIYFRDKDSVQHNDGLQCRCVCIITNTVEHNATAGMYLSKENTRKYKVAHLECKETDLFHMDVLLGSRRIRSSLGI
jgi:hypothetical protein